MRRYIKDETFSERKHINVMGSEKRWPEPVQGGDNR
jgi:hypothetical protein